MRMRRRLALYGALVTGTAMLLFGALLITLAGAAGPQDQDDRLAAASEATATELGEIDLADLPGSTPLTALDITAANDPFTVVSDPDGTTLFTTGLVAGARLGLPDAVIVEALETGAAVNTIELAPGLEVRLSALPATMADGRPVVVATGQPTRSLADDLQGLRVVIWIAIVLTLITASFASWLVAGRAIRPLRRLAETTDRIGRTGDLTQRLPKQKSNDEVGRLTHSFNSMLDRLQQMQGDLADALESQKKFVTDASHELRSPLTTIRSNAGFLMERPDAGDADRSEAVTDIAAESERMAALVDQLLELARSGEDGHLILAEVDLADIAADVVRTARRRESQIEFRPGHPTTVLGDTETLTRLVWILVDNAIRHGAPPIDVSAGGRDGRVVLRVADRGRGIPLDQLDLLFERFHRGDSVRSGPGTGLGLAIARTIADRHGATITADNLAEGGAVFTVSFPPPEA